MISGVVEMRGFLRQLIEEGVVEEGVNLVAIAVTTDAKKTSTEGTIAAATMIDERGETIDSLTDGSAMSHPEISTTEGHQIAIESAAIQGNDFRRTEVGIDPQESANHSAERTGMMAQSTIGASAPRI
jgi:hypothetical protein